MSLAVPDHVPEELVFGPEYRNDQCPEAVPFVDMQAARALRTQSLGV